MLQAIAAGYPEHGNTLWIQAAEDRLKQLRQHGQLPHAGRAHVPFIVRERDIEPGIRHPFSIWASGIQTPAPGYAIDLRALSNQPLRAASIAPISIFRMVIMASKARFASASPAGTAFITGDADDRVTEKVHSNALEGMLALASPDGRKSKADNVRKRCAQPAMKRMREVLNRDEAKILHARRKTEATGPGSILGIPVTGELQEYALPVELGGRS